MGFSEFSVVLRFFCGAFRERERFFDWTFLGFCGMGIFCEFGGVCGLLSFLRLFSTYSVM